MTEMFAAVLALLSVLPFAPVPQERAVPSANAVSGAAPQAGAGAVATTASPSAAQAEPQGSAPASSQPAASNSTSASTSTSTGAATSDSSSEPGLLLKGALVHVHQAGAAPIRADIFIEHGRIQRVEPNLQLPTGAREIDLAGAHVVPGLIDALVGFDPDHDALYLDAGVTLVRDAGNALDRIQTLRETKARDAVPGPAVLSALVRLEGDRPAAPAAMQLQSLERAQQLVPRLIELAPDWLYVADKLPLEIYKVVAEAGATARVSVWSSQGSADTFAGSVELGQRRWLYLDALLPKGVDWEIVQPGAFDESVRALAGAQGTCVPVLIGLAQRLKDAGDHAPVLDLLAPMYATQWEAERAMRKDLMSKPDYFKLGERVVKKQAALVKRLAAAGVRLVPGSGAPSPWIPPGQGLHDELERWTDAGLAPADVLELATRGAAQALDRGAERGSIEPGKIADLLVADADPSAGLAPLRKPRAVVLRGHWLARADLDARVERTRARLDALRAKDREPLVVAPPELPAGTLVLSGYVELRALGSRVSGERWAVVRENGGSIAFVGRMQIVGDGTVAGREMQVLQRVRNGELEEFEVRMLNGKDQLVARGLWIAGRFNIERRLNQNFLGGDSVKERLAAIDVGSVTTPLLFGLRERDATLPVLYLHDALVPELVAWKLELRENGGQLVQTAQGGMGVQIAPDGSIALWRESRGPSLIEARILESRADAGGLPPSPARASYRPPRAKDAQDAREKDQGKDSGAGSTSAPARGANAANASAAKSGAGAGG